MPIDEAIKRIGDNPRVHTFMQTGFALLGCDHDLIEDMRKHGVEESGEAACKVGHRLVIPSYPVSESGTTPLFIEAIQGQES